MKKHDDSIGRGQHIRTETGPVRDYAPANGKEALMGRHCTGGPTDVSHSLSGAGKVKTYDDAGSGKGKKSDY